MQHTPTRVIRGGSSLTESTKTKVANVDLAPDFAADASQVTFLHLGNLNLSASISTLVPNFPSSTHFLWLPNTLLQTFPTEVKGLKNLATLYVSGVAARLSVSHVIGYLPSLIVAVLSRVTTACCRRTRSPRSTRLTKSANSRICT